MKILLLALAFSSVALAGQKEIDQIRDKHQLPLLGASVVSSSNPTTYMSGLRKWGDKTPALTTDSFHLGSCTKAMTATLIALFVERGLLKWDMTLEESFPKLKLDPAYKKVRLDTLTAHRSGLPDLADFQNGRVWNKLWNPQLNPVDGRRLVAEELLAAPPLAEPGAKFIYNNANYMIAGAILEARTGKSWETLIKDELFKPLKMTSCGFGPQANPKANPPDQPWPHVYVGSTITPKNPDFGGDNPPTLGPAGTVHCSLQDWGKFAQLHMDGFNGKPTAILQTASFKKLHESYPGQDYTYGGWIRANRPWAGGPTLTHSGSNTMNFAVIWLAPLKNTGFLSVTNIAGGGADQATDEAIASLIQERKLP